MAKTQHADKANEKPDPIDKSDAAPHPIPAGEGGKQPMEPIRDPRAGGGPGPAEAKSVDHGTLGIHTTDGIKTVQTIGEKPSGPAKPGDAVDPPLHAVADKGGRVAVIWAQPGHETLGVGQLIRVPKDYAENLRRAGRARYASKQEVENADPNYQIREFDSV